MADFKLRRRKKSDDAPQEPVAPSSEQSRSVLSQLGGAAASGLHTVGSLLNWPSRAVWGSANYLSGHPDGFGNLSPTDSTGGIEASRFLSNHGVIPKNDESKFEWMDPIRGAIDIAGDPTTILAPLTLTKAGAAMQKTGSLTPGIVRQIRNGERGLVGLQLPFSSVSRGAVGTGAKVADAIESVSNKTGIGQLAKKVSTSAPARYARAMFDARVSGKLHPAIQRHASETDAARRTAQTFIDRDAYAMAMKQSQDQLTEPHHAEILRDILEGIPNPLATAAHHSHAADMKAVNDSILAQDIALGIRTGHLADDDVSHFARRLLAGVEVGGEHGFEMAANKVHAREELYKQLGGTNQINRIVKDADADAAIQAASHLPKSDQVLAAANVLTAKYPNLDPDKLGQLAAKMVGVPEMRKQGLFGNHPLYDLHEAARSANSRFHGAKQTFNAIGDSMHAGPHGTNVGSFLNSAGFDPQAAAQNISQITGKSVGDILQSHIPDDLANELRSFAPSFRATPAVKGVSDAVKQMGTLWKSWALAAPASRVRDAVSGAIQNVLTGHSGGLRDAFRILHGEPLVNDFLHLKEVRDLMAKHKITQGDAIKAILAAEAPRSSGFIADVQPFQVGASLADMLANIPGLRKSGVRDVLRRAGKSLVHGELDRSGNPIAEGKAWNPLHVAGVNGRKSTTYGPAAASNTVAQASDELNRVSGILGQMRQGVEPSVAGRNTRSAQVDFDPSTYSDFEKSFVKQAIPFWSFNSRMGLHTGKQLLNPGSPTSQLVKAQDRAQGNDPVVPDSISDGTAIPLGTSADGTRRFLSNLGTMHESSVKQIGTALSGDRRGAMYDLAGMSHPILKMLGERMTNQSFYNRGEEQSHLFPNVGGTIANLLNQAGLRDAEAGPVQYPGSDQVEMALQLSPLMRAATVARTLSDPRKDIGTKALNTLTGAKVTDLSPKRQEYQLRKVAEKLAIQSGAKSRSDVYFSRSELDKLKESDPELYRKQKQIQQILNDLKSKRSVK